MKNAKQMEFFNRLKLQIPENYSLAQEIADLLNISIDSAYRRMRGEKPLNFNELEKICFTFGLQPLELLTAGQSNFVAFSYYPEIKTYADFKKYIFQIRDDITKTKLLKDLTLYFTAADLPLFVHFKYPELTKFKFFYWLKSVIGDKAFENKTLDFNLIEDDLMEAAEKIYTIYQSIPSIEIWSDDTLSSTLKQLTYYWDAGSFESKVQAEIIINQLIDLLKTVKTMADKCSKLTEGSHIDTANKNFQLYFSEVTIGNNCIWLKSEKQHAVYLSHYTYKSIKTTDLNFIDDTQQWIENLIQKSTLVSGIGEKQRFQFFKGLEKKVEVLFERLEK